MTLRIKIGRSCRRLIKFKNFVLNFILSFNFEFFSVKKKFKIEALKKKKEIDMLSYSFHISSKKNAINTKSDLLRVSCHNSRNYSEVQENNFEMNLELSKENIFLKAKKILKNL